MTEKKVNIVKINDAERVYELISFKISQTDWSVKKSSRMQLELGTTCLKFLKEQPKLLENLTAQFI